jgi:hypothetical protein
MRIFMNSTFLLVTCHRTVVFTRHSTNKTYRHDIPQILLDVELNTITTTPILSNLFIQVKFWLHIYVYPYSVLLQLDGQQYLRYIVAVGFIGGVSGENHGPMTSHWQTLSHNLSDYEVGIILMLYRVQFTMSGI